jgi:hypothetical protein
MCVVGLERHSFFLPGLRFILFKESSYAFTASLLGLTGRVDSCVDTILCLAVYSISTTFSNRRARKNFLARN